jgi:hypothetical protein
MNLILALLLIILEAVFEGLKVVGYHVASEIIEAIYLIIVSLMAFGWLNRKYIFKDIKADRFIIIIIGFLLLRFAIFDSIWNIAAGQPWNYHGTTKLYDKIMSSLGSWGWMLKAIAGLWGISWLMNWREGIVKYFKK